MEKAMELFRKYDVYVASDEIWSDIILAGHKHIPTQSVSEDARNRTFAFYAPSKTFNLAGLQTAAVIVPDAALRHRVNRGLNTDEVAEPNVFAAIAPIAAFTQGGAWLDELREYLWENRKFAEDFIREEIPELGTVSADATYLLWIDCNALPGDLSELAEFIRKESGLYVCDGREYGNGYGFLRMNLACRRELLKEGLERLKRSIHSYRKGISNGII